MDERFTRLLAHEDHLLSVEGVELMVRDGVFAPDPGLTHSTTMILQHLPDIHGKTVLDLGCGTGVLALHAGIRGAERVIAADLNERAVSNARENVSRHGLETVIEVRRSDLFSEVPESFDVICANLPILDEVWETSSGFTTRVIGRFLHDLSGHLKSGGRVFLPWGSFADIAPLRDELARLPYEIQEWNEERMGYTWTLFEISL